MHDAYIESAEMLVKSDPLSAVDVYMKFPVSENPSFDDAYIFGEIIRILMKFEKYDDERLASSMITYGKILGLGMLLKQIICFVHFQVMPIAHTAICFLCFSRKI